MAGAVAKPDAALGKQPGAAPAPAVATGGRIKYADPRTLPSFPSTGLAPDGAAASAAATLGWSNQKPVELWKPDKTSSASAAAVLAKDYKMSPVWEPSANPDGHKAALLAVGSAGAALKQSKVKPPASHSQETWGNSAATQAFHANRPSTAEPTNLSHGSSAATQAFQISRTQSARKAQAPSPSPHAQRSLVAAKGAMSGGKAAATSDVGFKDVHAAEARAASSALDGATRAHRASMQPKVPIGDAGAVSVVTMTRNMFTSHPPVKPEVDEQTYNERLHQSALDMARKMYQRQQQMVDQTREAHEDGVQSGKTGTYLNLQDAAYKQAQERLAKLHDEHQQSREYQEYYGSGASPRRRFTVGGRLRRRSSSSDDVDDRQRSQKIREQMSMFSTKLSQVDKEKREKDREALLAAAQRNVKARLQGMDQKVYQETGRVNPSMVSDWELKAQQAAQSRHDTRSENRGKVDIGGGKFMSPEEVDAIAARKVQPVLDDINEKAEAERERQAVLKMEEQARRDEAEKQKARDREIKDIHKKTKDEERQQERAKRQQEKEEEKTKRDEEKAARAEQRRLAKEEKRRSKHGAIAAPDHADHQEHTAVAQEATQGEQAAGHAQPAASAAPPTVDTNAEAPDSPQSKSEASTSPTSRVKGWIRNRFSRGKSMSETGDKRRSFLGGAAMREYQANGSAVSLENRPSSMRDVAYAGKSSDEHANKTGGGYASKSIDEPVGKTDADNANLGGVEAGPSATDHHLVSGGEAHEPDSHGVSPVSTPLEEEKRLGVDFEDDDTRNGRRISIEPPKPIEDPSMRTGSSPNRDSRFREEIDS
ncbi:Eisosome assembly protein [Purpureocillium takamizusanense]|uniref:Eisosome assembly protein n=1 Tax=Purpureocillium takamizusanense TaxID=2060973 RepID=A0A9Q8QHU8_9HYPO|nr:Eisosome assembly protein [Purpureocillium takamizusanense]UNI19139.1 Eisosome assembly protein [Purpureocillium takamizusanense]